MISIHNTLQDIKTLDENTLKQCKDMFPSHKKDEVIYADPPWEYGSAGQSISNQCSVKYPTMNIEKLKKLPLREISSKDCALFLWTTNPKLPDALELIKHWGFDYKTVFKVWRKLNANGTPVCVPGWWSRSSTELVLVASKGTPLKHWKTSNNEPQEYSSIREHHSAKPSEIRDIVYDFLNCNNRIELFARSKDTRWDSWGLEIPGFFYECDCISNVILCNSTRTVGTQCCLEVVHVKKGKKPSYISNHKPDCSCCICKKIRLRDSTKVSTSEDKSGSV